MSHSSPADFYKQKEDTIREQQIAFATMKLTGEKLAECFRTEGMNSFVNCRDLREKYWALCNDRYRGMIFPPDEEPANRQVPGLIPPTPKH
jgi:hypothetical protein